MSMLIAEASQMDSNMWCILTMGYNVDINNEMPVYANNVDEPQKRVDSKRSQMQ